MARGGRGGGGSFGGGGGGRGGGSFGGGRGGGSSFGGSRGGGQRLGGGSSLGRGGRGGGPSRPSTGNQRSGGTSGFGGYRPGGFFGPRPFYGGWGGGYGYGRRRPYRRGGCGGCGGGGCLTGIILLFAIMMIFNIFGSRTPNMNHSPTGETQEITQSTIEREPIREGLVNETSYFQDEVGGIRNASELENGLRYFYDKTNIQPFVYIMDNLNGNPNPDPEEINAFASELYDELFTDEAHLLLVHFDNWESYDYDFSFHTVIGSDAHILMDDEAENILYDYLGYHYYSDLEDSAYYAQAFRDTADRIMNVKTNPWIPVATVAGAAVIIYLLYSWWSSAFNKPDNTGGASSNEGKKENTDEFDF